MMGGQEEKEERRERELWSMDRGLQMHDGKKEEEARESKTVAAV